MTAAGYNRFHDQLVLSAGTDYLVKLWRAAAISSAPPALDEAEPGVQRLQAGEHRTLLEQRLRLGVPRAAPHVFPKFCGRPAAGGVGEATPRSAV